MNIYHGNLTFLASPEKYQNLSIRYYLQVKFLPSQNFLHCLYNSLVYPYLIYCLSVAIDISE